MKPGSKAARGQRTRRAGQRPGPSGRRARSQDPKHHRQARRRTRPMPRRPPRGCGRRVGRGADRGRTRRALLRRKDSRSRRQHRRRGRNRRAPSRRRRAPPRLPARRETGNRDASRRRLLRRRGGMDVRRQESCFARLGAKGAGGAGMSRGRVRPVWRPLDTRQGGLGRPRPAGIACLAAGKTRAGLWKRERSPDGS